jgi:glycerophosphoryl diester phosphodiesterase
MDFQRNNRKVLALMMRTGVMGASKKTGRIVGSFLIIACSINALFITAPVFANGQRHGQESTDPGGINRVLPGQIIAHRGYWNAANSAQNSVKALELADSLGIYGSEFDVHLTADNIPIISHDDKINGISIQTARYDALKDYQLSNGEKLPALEQYLTAGKDLSIKMILEVKRHAAPERSREAARIIVDMVRLHNMEDRVEYITFDYNAGLELISLVPGGKIAYLTGDLTPEQVHDRGFTALDYELKVMRKHPSYFHRARKLGITVIVWKVNSVKDMREMIRRGADFITTDIPFAAMIPAFTPDPGQRPYSFSVNRRSVSLPREGFQARFP